VVGDAGLCPPGVEFQRRYRHGTAPCVERCAGEHTQRNLRLAREAGLVYHDWDMRVADALLAEYDEGPPATGTSNAGSMAVLRRSAPITVPTAGHGEMGWWAKRSPL
jgi:hypothetical protein